MTNRAEVLFERFCDRVSFRCERIPTDSEQTPDYRIFLLGNEVITEVKQINPNPDERQQQEILESGGIAIGGGTPGDRVRRRISEANPQLAAISKGELPTIVVIYNNVFLAYHTDPYHIRVAMYGMEAWVLAVPQDYNERPRFIGRKFAGKRRMTTEHNTSISAVGVIYLDPLGDLDSPHLAIYHNVYAKIPLPPEWLRPYGIKQFTLEEAVEGRYQEWLEL